MAGPAASGPHLENHCSMWSRQTVQTVLCLACPPKVLSWPHDASPSRSTQTRERAFPGDPSHTQAAPSPPHWGVCSRPPALPVRAAGPSLHPTWPGWAAVSGGTDGFGHRQPHGPPEPAWGLTRTRALESHQDLSASAALAPQEPTLPPCSGWSVSPGIPWACVKSSPWRVEPGSEASGTKDGQDKGLARGIVPHLFQQPSPHPSAQQPGPPPSTCDRAPELSGGCLTLMEHPRSGTFTQGYAPFSPTHAHTRSHKYALTYYRQRGPCSVLSQRPGHSPAVLHTQQVQRGPVPSRLTPGTHASPTPPSAHSC